MHDQTTKDLLYVLHRKYLNLPLSWVIYVTKYVVGSFVNRLHPNQKDLFIIHVIQTHRRSYWKPCLTGRQQDIKQIL